MYPLKYWDDYPEGYRFGQRTFYGTKHLGLDKIVPKGFRVYAPFDGEVVSCKWGPQGGNTVTFRGQGVTIRFMHLSTFKTKPGKVKAGTILGLTGNTGAFTTGPHLHVDISKGDTVKITDFSNFVNPSTFNWKV